MSGLVLLSVASACTPAVAPYSERAYSQAVDLKVESLRLMSLAEQPFANQEKRVQRLQLDMERAFEFARGRPRNEHSTRQWELMMDAESNLMGGFLALWERDDSLQWPFIEQAKQIVSQAFDEIIGLESGKLKVDETL